MDNKTYLKSVVLKNEKSEIHSDKIDPRLLHAVLGISDEAGELTGAIKKSLMYGKDLDLVNIAEELGDLIWYVFLAIDSLGLTIERVQEINSAKLNEARYKEGFSHDEAINRDLKRERDVLESAVRSAMGG